MEKKVYYCVQIGKYNRAQINFLTSPKVLNDRSMSLPAVILVGIFDMIITKTIPRAFFPGRRYHSSSQDVTATFSACHYTNRKLKIRELLQQAVLGEWSQTCTKARI